MITYSNGVIFVGWQSGRGDGPGSAPGPDPRLPLGPGNDESSRDPRLAGFAKDGEWDACPPSAALAAALEGVSGAGWRCPGASRAEMLGVLRQWQAMEAWAAAGKLGALRALIRDDDQPLPGGGYHGDLPNGWSKALTHEVALALSMPAVSADKLMWTAWSLEAVLPGVGALLAGGQLTLAKARAVEQALDQLSGRAAAEAEAIILPELPGKTYGQVEKLAVQAAVTVDPESATRRREDAEQHKCRVQLFREDSGAAALAGRDMPTDQTLAAHASICARAEEYRDSGAFPKDTRMDQYRVAAYLDLLNGIGAQTRIATGELPTVIRADQDDPGQGGRAVMAGPGDPGNAPTAAAGWRSRSPGDDPRGTPVPPGASSSTPRLADLVLPLATLLGLAERPGEGHGLGPLDPDLCRELAAAAVGSPWTRLCVTVTDTDGIAIGHGCAKSPRRPRTTRSLFGLPARANLTITASRLAELAATGPPGSAGPPEAAESSGPRGSVPWSVARADGPGPPGGFGAWILTLPDGRQLIVELEPVPTRACDHRHESHGYQPNDTLRHLVQVRDGTCTFPPCSRPARESDFEHATPYQKGGRTCACNAGARSRACHQVKQSPGWTVTQPRPGWHQWETPAGRVYLQGPKRYPA